MTDPNERLRRRASAARRRGLKRLVLVILLALAGVLVAAVFLQGRGGGRAAVRTAPPPPSLPLPPQPIPGYLLIADRGNNRALLVDGNKRILWRYPPRRTKPSYPFRFDDDTFFGPDLGTIISNQEDQHTIQVISFPAGRVLWHYGHPNHTGSIPGYLHSPDDAYLLPNGVVTVADAYNCRVLFISRDKRIVRQIGRTKGCVHDPPRSLASVNGATPMPDGGTLVSEIQGSWIDRFSSTGRLMWSMQAPVSYPSDPQWLGGGRILLADYAKPGHALIMSTHGRVIWRYGPASGPGMLNHPSLALRLRPGLIAVNDDFRHRVVLIDVARHRIVWQYGHTDKKGARPGYLNTPDGMDLLPYERVKTSKLLRGLLSP